MKASIFEIFKYLSAIEPYISNLGSVSRKFCLKKTIEPGFKNTLPRNELFLEYNINKIEAANRIFNKSLVFFDPRSVRFPIHFRPIIFICLFLPYKYMNIIFHIALIKYLDKVMDKNINIFILNPYSIFHYSLSFLDNYKSIFINNYKRNKFNADHYYSYKTILEIYGIKDNCTIIKPLKYQFVEETLCVSFYFTSLEHKHPKEEYLRNFSKWVSINIDLPAKVFLHRYDSNIDKRNEYLEKYALIPIKKIIQNIDNVDTQDSLSRLSLNQISFSSMSSICYKLLSLDVNHFVFFSEDELKNNSSQLLSFAQKSDRFISIKESFEKVCELTGLHKYRIVKSNQV